MYGLTFETDCDETEMNYSNNSEKVVFGELTEYTVTLVDDKTIMDIIGVSEFNDYIPKKEGYIFDGWYTNSTFSQNTKVIEIPDDVTEDIVLFAKWIFENEPIIKASFSFIDYAEGKVKGSVNYDYITSDCNVLIALYEGNKMTAIASYDAFRHDVGTPFEITADIYKEYKIKAFFWNYNTQTPCISYIESTVNTSE